MPTGLYDDAPEQPEAQGTPPAPEQEEAPEKEEAGDQPTAEIPKAILGGKEFKPGQEVMLQVVKVMDDSVLVKYASEKEGGEEEAAPPEEPGAQVPSGMGAMMG